MVQSIHVFRKNKSSKWPCSWINSAELLQLLNQVNLGFLKYTWRLCVVQHQCLQAGGAEWHLCALERGLEEGFDFLWCYSWKFLIEKPFWHGAVPAAHEAVISFPGKGQFQSPLGCAVSVIVQTEIDSCLHSWLKSLKYGLDFPLQDCSSKWAVPWKTFRLTDIICTLRTSQAFLIHG